MIFAKQSKFNEARQAQHSSTQGKKKTRKVSKTVAYSKCLQHTCWYVGKGFNTSIALYQDAKMKRENKGTEISAPDGR